MASDEVHIELQSIYARPRSGTTDARIQIFAGPGMSESVPTSVSAFSHRRRERADSSASLTSFAYYDEDHDSDQDQDLDEGAVAIVDDDDIEYDGYTAEEIEDMDRDLEAGRSISPSPSRRSSSGGKSHRSVKRPLLRRHSSASSAGSGSWKGRRSNQKIYIMTEDLTIVVAGFRNSTVGFIVYTMLCVGTFGLAWLLLRWLPRWQVALTGKSAPLKDADWVVRIACWRHGRQ